MRKERRTGLKAERGLMRRRFFALGKMGLNSGGAENEPAGRDSRNCRDSADGGTDSPDANTAAHAKGKNAFATPFIALLLAACLAFGGCSANGSGPTTGSDQESGGTSIQTTETASPETSAARATIADIPQYSGALCIDINDGQPGFTEDDVNRGAFMQFSDLDFEGRCGEAFARIGTDTVSSEARGDISRVHPSGWVQHKYDFVDDGVLYNRCHLIAHQLCGENANEKNLITGTRTFNVVGMLYYEELVGNYVRSTGNHVLYRVTPLFAANDLVARGVQMEAESIEDGGAAIRFNVFVYNVEPGVEIDYVTGESWESDATPKVVSKGEATKTSAKASDAALASTDAGTSSERATKSNSENAEANASSSTSSAQQDYVLNVKNKKFHKPSCTAASEISSANRQDFTGTREELIERGYSPCGQCKP